MNSRGGQGLASLQMVASMVILGTVGLVIKWVPFSSTAIAAFRGGIGVLSLAAIARLTGHRIGWGTLRARWKLLLFSGVALGLNWLCSFAAYKFADVSVVTLCLYVYPVFLLLCAPSSSGSGSPGREPSARLPAWWAWSSPRGR